MAAVADTLERVTLTPDESTYGTRPVAGSTPPGGANSSASSRPLGSQALPLTLGKFRIERELARGGMGRVVLASLAGAEGFEKPLVLKLIREDLAGDPSFVARFVEEAKIAVKLTHPNIVPVYELGLVDGTYYIAMEYVRGVSLAELVQRKSSDNAPPALTNAAVFGPASLSFGILSPEIGAYVGAEICRALDYAHRRLEVVHRDVTPRNVMIDEEGHVRLIDFGVAQRVLAFGDRVFGSPGHMPPEQMRGQALGPESDVFAVGALLLELWSGHAPFRRETTAACEAALQQAPAKPSATNPALQPLDSVMARSVATDRTLRPRTAEDLGKDLRRFLSNYDASEVARELGRLVRDALDARDARTLEKQVHSAYSSNPIAPSTVESGVSRTFATRPLTPSAALADVVPTPETAAPSLAPRVAQSASTRNAANARSIVLVLGGCMLLAWGATWISAAEPLPIGVPTVAATGISIEPSTAPPLAASVASAATLSASANTAASAPPSTPLPPASSRPTSGANPTAVTTLFSSATAQPLRAHLTLLCDPGTVAFVDGTARGTCPLRELAVPVGAHQVSFHFDPTGETRAIQVVLESARTTVIKADFTRAVPEIHEVR